MRPVTVSWPRVQVSHSCGLSSRKACHSGIATTAVSIASIVCFNSFKFKFSMVSLSLSVNFIGNVGNTWRPTGATIATAAAVIVGVTLYTATTMVLGMHSARVAVPLVRLLVHHVVANADHSIGQLVQDLGLIRLARRYPMANAGRGFYSSGDQKRIFVAV